MKRGRSFLLLLAAAAAVGAYVWFVELPRDPNAVETTAEDVFTVEEGDIREIRLRNEAGDESTLQRDGERWVFAGSDGVEVDPAEASNLVSGLADLELQRVVDEQPPSLAEFGLETPRVTVSFTAADGAERTLWIGNRTPTGGDLYAKLGDTPRVFLIGAWLDETFNRSRFDLRDKAALKFSRDAVTGVTLASASGTVTLSRSEGEWALTAPVEAPADNAAADDIVDALQSARMQSVVDDAGAVDTGLSRPAVTAAVTAGPTRAVLEIGGTAPDGTRYARDAVRNLTFTVEASLVDRLTKTADDLKRQEQ